MYDWLLGSAQLGFGAEEEEAYELMLQLRDFQRRQAQQAANGPPLQRQQRTKSAAGPEAVGLPQPYQQYERVAVGADAAQRAASPPPSGDQQQP